MNKRTKISLLIISLSVMIYFIYQILFIRTVNYEIAGIDIPSKYSILSGKVTPIMNYKGRPLTKSINDYRSDKLNLEYGEETAAKFRWALFSEWAKSHPEFEGWQSDREIFERANKEFQNTMRTIGINIKVAK